MLAAMRNGAKSWVAKGLFLLLVLSFAIWGAGPIFSGGRVHTVATAGKVKITNTEADSTLQRQVRSLEQSYGTTLTPEMVQMLGLRRSVLQQMVMQSLYDQEAQRMGIQLDLNSLKQTISMQPVFRNEDGKFDPQRFAQMLRSVGLNEATYIATMRGDIARTMLMGAVRAGAQVPAPLTQAAYAFQNEMRDASARLIEAASIKSIAAPTDDELASYYEAQKANHMAPEYRALSIVVLSPEQIAQSISVDDAAARAAFDADPSLYAEAEKRNLIQITTSDKAVAEKIAAQTASGKSLADAAKANNLMAVPLDGVTQSALVPELADKIFALSANKPSEVIQSSMGYHVIEITKITPASAPDFDKAKAGIIAQLKAEQAQEALSTSTRQLEDALAGGATVAEAAQQTGAQLITLPAVTADGQNSEGKAVSTELGTELEQVLQAAFALNAGEQTQTIQTEKHVIIAKVDTITPSAELPLENVRDKLVASWKLEQQKQAAKAQAEKLMTTLNDGGKVEGLTKLSNLKRDASNKGTLPAAAVTALFGHKSGQAFTVEDDKGTWVVKVEAIEKADLAKADLKETETALKEQLATDLLEQLGLALRTRDGVTLDEGWINQGAGTSADSNGSAQM
jgi:peptidyl-prolyl cis-trans isomerase D